MNNEIYLRFRYFQEYILEVGKYLVEYHQQQELGIQQKGRYDLVTEADTHSEAMIKNEILNKFSNDSILGEESGEVAGNSNYRWIVDPLDGTTNYAHNLPLYGVSIALEEISSLQIVAGIVYFPEMNDLYTAVRGEGAFKNNKKIQVSNTKDLKDSLFTTGFPYDRDKKIDLLLSYYKNILLKTRGIRRTGAATLDLCWVAEGRFDCFYEIGLKPWDMAAGCLIVEEAGGKCSSLDGDEYSPYKPSLIASNPYLHELVLKEFVR